MGLGVIGREIEHRGRKGDRQPIEPPVSSPDRLSANRSREQKISCMCVTPGQARDAGAPGEASARDYAAASLLKAELRR